MRQTLPLLSVVLLLASLSSELASLASGLTDASPAGAQLKGPAHRFQKIAEGVYSAIGTGAMNVGGNSAVIVNERDVVLVDSHITPAAARALVNEVKTLTDRPVRAVVNTHFHFDHTDGNQIFPPEVDIIGHAFTREMLLGDVLRHQTYVSFTAGLPRQIDELKQQIAAEKEPVKRQGLEDRLTVQQSHVEALTEVKPTPPNVTLRTEMTLYRGGREIQLHFFGRGHTGGDVVVFLPKERVVCTGDLLTAGLAYMGDAFVSEWIDTLEALEALDFDTVIPGHGEPFTDKERIGRFQNYLKDVWTQVTRLRAQGLSADEAARRVDLRAHKPFYPQIEGLGVDRRAVDRIYDVLDQERR